MIGARFFWLFLTVFFYLMWTGRWMDDFGSGSWIETHVLLAAAVVGGLTLRIYLHRATAAQEKRVGRWLAMAVFFLALFGGVTEALVLALAAGRPRTVKYLREHFFPQIERVIPVLLIVFLAAVSNTHPVFVAAPLVFMAGMGIKLLYGEQGRDWSDVWREENAPGVTGQADGTRRKLWKQFGVWVWLFLSAYYIYGQVLNTWPACSGNPICEEYPYAWLRMRCYATCTLVHANTDGLFNIALLVFVVTATSALNSLGSAIERLRKPVVQRGQST
jgi:hypothetical protein